MIRQKDRNGGAVVQFWLGELPLVILASGRHVGRKNNAIGKKKVNERIRGILYLQPKEAATIGVSGKKETLNYVYLHDRKVRGGGG